MGPKTTSSKLPHTHTHTYIYIYIYICVCVCVCVTGMEIGLRKRRRGLDAFILIGVLAWMLADVQTNGGISDVHTQWFSHRKIRADDCDIMR